MGTLSPNQKMTPLEIAQHLKTIRQKEFACANSSSLARRYIGDAIVTIDPASAASPYPSANKNAVSFLGCEARAAPADLRKTLDVFKESGIERFFFHLGPTLQQEEIIAWLTENHFEPYQGTRYPTLCRAIRAAPPHETDLRVARVFKHEIETHADAITRIFNPWPSSFFFESSGQPGFDHFLAFEQNTPVSAAILATHNQFAYLGWAATAEAHRGRGGQNALIAARLNRAAELGCQIACSETLTALKTSLSNLLRNGFEVAYEKQVFVWEA